ncbi:PfkB family carbohydrate kinase [Phaeodactylibacter sp.]|jgi:sugar/nucleoside kinase (ribokinase family)|uniref:PfkB family carbohydrate kinase n=1 Tax=Phaeodactylibacter sp. TaxID=1940289 RepID=UPI0025FDD87C|nr:PfkB family carbohydrate kinase [Phaeodactylibacter sp.]MCI4649872.1 PfkB family carbohydrate kinase [Phaeodactylibacter sp.]MCI5092288.1 PfkB family carbohydrate kinase [Phaeodactylibacter sp.]
MSLLAVGTVAFDDIETPFGRAEKVVGGAATYITLAASYFTDRLKIVSVIGDDFPQQELDFMASRGIDLDGLQVKEGEKSFFWAGKYHDNLNDRDTLDTQLNVLADFKPVLPENYKDAEYLMLGNLTPSVQSEVIEQLNNRPKFIALDTMNFWMDTAMESLLQVLKKIDGLIINDEEARQLSGEHSLVKAAEVIHGMGPKHLVIKKGEHGALLFEGGKVFFAPALPLAEVFDPTGAGDTFAGGFMGYIARTGDLSFENMKRAVIYGSAMASFCVEKFGIERMKELNNKAINKRIARFVDLVNFDADIEL